MVRGLAQRQHRRHAGVGALEDRGPLVPRTTLEAGRDRLAEVAPAGQVLAGRDVLPEAEQPHELLVELALQRAHRHVLAVGRLVRPVVRAAAVEEVGAPPVLPAAGGQHAVDHRGEVGRAVHDRRVHDLARAGRARVVEGGEDADDEVERAARVVPDEVRGDGRGLVRSADHAEGAGQRDVRDVVPRARGERALLAPAGHPSVDELRVAGVAGLGADAEALGDARAVALDEDVGAVDQVEDAVRAVGCLQVDDHRALVAVGDVVVRVDRESHAARPVHADDVRAQVGEEHGGERAGPDARQLDHAHAGERAVPCRSCRCHQAPSTVTQLM
jgi:hypothetical protein